MKHESSFKISTLADNLVYKRGLQAEHGLSFYIQINDINFLFDTGQSSLFYENAVNMGIDLAKVSHIVISHGHYDHTGGLGTILAKNSSAQLYIKRLALQPQFRGSDNIGIPADIVIPENRTVFAEEGITEITENLFLFSFSSTDEQYLIYRENQSLTLITGCSHQGVENIIESTEKAFNGKITHLFGGFHTSRHTREQLSRLATFINRSNLVNIGTNHCTGTESFSFLKGSVAKNIFYFGTGCTFFN